MIYIVGNENKFDTAMESLLKKMQNKYDDLLRKFMRDGTASVLSGQSTIMNQLRNDITAYQNKLDEQHKYYNATWGNKVFKILVKIDTLGQKMENSTIMMNIWF